MAVDTYHFDFTENATRKHILGTMIGEFEEMQRAMVGRVVGDLTLPTQAQYDDMDKIDSAINRTVANDAVKETAKEIYQILAEAEATAHGCPLEEVHFHEVGTGMTVREVLGICTAFSLLDAGKITATPVQVGSGTVECAHGTLDIPAPATAAIIEKYQIPVCEEKLEGELCTPTSAALIAHFVDEFTD